MQCWVCGFKQNSYEYKDIVTADLSRSWKLTPRETEAFNRRESSYCRNCGSSLRSRALAEAIMKNYPESKSKYFIDWVDWAKERKLAIAEINYCGHLHKYLAEIPRIKVSQYHENTWRARLANLVKGIRSEDITHLSYKSNSFDLVLHSEVLEHVYDVGKALAECRRILKPDGVCLFTTPLIMERKTKQKAKIDEKTKKVKHLGVPSYHGSGEKDNLVFWEFGGDFIIKNRLTVALAYPRDYVWVLKLKK